MDTKSNGQSAAKLLNTIVHEEGSTTISRKESTVNNLLEKVDVLLYSFNQTLPSISCIYLIHCSGNNKSYVGSCLNLNARIIRHRSYLKRGAHHSKKLQNSYNKYGIELLKVAILENVTDSYNLVECEKYWMDQLDSFKNGLNCTDICLEHKKYNLTLSQIKKRSEKSKMSVICLDMEGNYLCEYDSITSAAKAINDQTTNISSCCKGKSSYVKDYIFVYKKEYNPFKDYSYKGRKYKVTEEHCKNIRLALKNKTVKKTKLQLEALMLRCSIPLAKYDLNHNLLKIYNSMKECRIENKIEQKKLRRIIDSKTPLGGFFYKEYENIV